MHTLSFIIFTLNLQKAITSNAIWNVYKGTELRASAFDYPPIFTMKKLSNGNYSYGGLVYEILGWMTEYLNITFKYIPVDPLEVTRLGTERTLFQQLDNNLVDMAPMLFEASLENLNHLAFSQPVWVDDFIILQAWPKEESRITAPIRPFTSIVWLLLLCSTILFIGISTIITCIESLIMGSKNRKPLSQIMYSQFEYVATIITSQGNYISYTAPTSLRIASSFWLLSMVVIIYAFSGLLTAMMTVPKLEPIVSTLDELARSKRFKITKEVHSVMTTQFLNATTGTYKILGDQLRNNPELLFGDNFQMIENVVKHDCAWPSVRLIINYVITVDQKATGKCRMTASTKSLPIYTAFQLGFPKGSPIPHILDQQLTPRTLASGLSTYLINKYFPASKACQVDSEKTSVTAPLTLDNLMAAYALLAMGLALSCLTLLLEKFVDSMKKLRERHIRTIYVRPVLLK